MPRHEFRWDPLVQLGRQMGPTTASSIKGEKSSSLVHFSVFINQTETHLVPFPWLSLCLILSSYFFLKGSSIDDSHGGSSSSRSHLYHSHVYHASFHHHHHHHNHHHHHPSLVLFWCLMFSLLSPLALSSSSSSSSASSSSSSSSSSSASSSSFSHISLGISETEGTKHNLHHAILRDESVARLHELGKVSDAVAHLERTFMSPASTRAMTLIRRWMEEAGLSTWVDNMGNVHGRVEPKNGSTQALLIGSHLDTVIDAGKYDGSLGIISAISALKVLNIHGKLEELKRPVEVIAFSDEEGVRFQSTFLGSAALAGIMPISRLGVTDKSGISVQDALKENSIDITEENLMQLKYDPASVWGYVEVHIEQGPVLGVVKGIAGQTRLKVTVKGSQGHAGTVPMSMRQDPMIGAAELIVLLESVCKSPKDYLSCNGQCNEETIESLSNSLVCTVGEISTWPSASNVIPGQVTFTVDLRTIDDVGRKAILHDLSNRMYQICDKRLLLCTIERKHDADAVISDQHLSLQLKSAAQSALKKMTGEIQDEVPMLMSGAGHDAMAMSHLTKVGMLFVRCRGGISHSPEEHVLDDDVGAAGLAILEFLESQM